MAKVRRFVSPEQSAYARWLELGVRIGMAGLLVVFVLYLIGYPAPHVPPDALPRYWGLSAARYLAAVGVQPGWGWLQLVGKGDYLNLVGISFLISLTMVCYLRVLPEVWRKGDMISAAIILLQVAVLLFAASGVAVLGHS